MSKPPFLLEATAGGCKLFVRVTLKDSPSQASAVDATEGMRRVQPDEVARPSPELSKQPFLLEATTGGRKLFVRVTLKDSPVVVEREYPSLGLHFL